MIHDAKIEITCDGNCCSESIEYDMPFVFSDYSGESGHYASNDADIETFLNDDDWIVDGDKHFCCEECKDDRT